MIKLNKPNFEQGKIVDDCLSNMKTGTRKSNILLSKGYIIKKTREYDELAQKGELYTIAKHENIQGKATKDDMKALYKDKFSTKGQGGRTYYDAIMLLASNAKCPYCGQQTVKTLDHYLPQSKYPTYTISPFNLVPSCKDCNEGSKSDISHNTIEEQTIHPYYDDFTDEIWIKAKLIEEEPIIFEFYVDSPKSWDSIKAERANNHFREFKLDVMYRVYASEWYIACENNIRRIYSKDGKIPAIERLQEEIDDVMCIRKNTWQAAMYQAIIECDWYWDKYIRTRI